MESSSFNKFIQLVQLDDKITEYSQDQTNLINLESKIQDQVLQLKAKLELALINLNKEQRKADILELELKSLDSTFGQIKIKIYNVISQKQLSLLEAELLDINKKKNELEEDLFILWGNIDHLKKRLEEERARIPAKIIELNSESEKFLNRISYLKKYIFDLEQLREATEEGIDTDLLKNYYIMKEKVSNPVVPATGNSCSACFFSLTKQEISLLKQSSLVNCKDCYRLLYLK